MADRGGYFFKAGGVPLNLAPSLERRFFNFWVSGTLAQISPKRAKISGKRAKTAENVRKIAKSV